MYYKKTVLQIFMELERHGPGREGLTKYAFVMGNVGSSVFKASHILVVRIFQPLLHQFRPFLF